MPENNNNFWNALLSAGASMYAQGKKKKEDNKQLEWMNSILADKRRYEQENIDRYKSSPAAQMSPMIMEMLVGAYAPKFKKYGIDMPLDRMLAAITGGGSGPGGGSGAPEGTSGSGGASQPKRSLSEIANDKPAARTVSDMIAAQLGRNSAYTAKTGVQTRMGANPEIAGHNGKTWTERNRAPQSGASASSSWGVSAFDLGSREDTRSMGGLGTDSSRKGTLATGGTVTYTPRPDEPSMTIGSRPDTRTIPNNDWDQSTWDEDPDAKDRDIKDAVSSMLGESGKVKPWMSKVANFMVDKGATGLGTAFAGPLGGLFGKRAARALRNSGVDFDKATAREWEQFLPNLLLGRDTWKSN